VPKPARGYSWPTATAGNTIAVRHGAYSPRLVRQAAQAIVTTLVEELAPEAPWLSSPAFQLDLEAYCDVVAARRMLADDITERKAAGKQVPLRSFEVLGSLTNAAGRVRQCWRMVFGHNDQATHCAEPPSWTGRWYAPSGEQWWRVWSCPDHIGGLEAVRQFRRRR
jgi:hypothetical protein